MYSKTTFTANILFCLLLLLRCCAAILEPDNSLQIFDSFLSNPSKYPLGCSPKITNPKKGLSMELYSYPYRKKGSHPCWDPAYLDPNFPRVGYKKNKLIARVDGVSGDINFNFHPKRQCTPIADYLPPNFNYNEPITTTNFTMLLYGYFKPKVTGLHTFDISADDLLFMNFGAGNAFDCCRRDSTADTFGNYVAWAIWGRRIVRNKLTVRLDKGIYYPLRLFFNNRDYYGQMRLTFKTEHGSERITDFSDYFFSVDDTSEGCPGLITYESECADVKSSTVLETDYITIQAEKEVLPIIKTIYYVGIPCSSSQSIYGSSSSSSSSKRLDCPSGLFFDPLAEKCVSISTPPLPPIPSSSSLPTSSQEYSSSSHRVPSSSHALIHSSSVVISTISSSIPSSMPS